VGATLKGFHVGPYRFLRLRLQRLWHRKACARARYSKCSSAKMFPRRCHGWQ